MLCKVIDIEENLDPLSHTRQTINNLKHGGSNNAIEFILQGADLNL